MTPTRDDETALRRSRAYIYSQERQITDAGRHTGRAKRWIAEESRSPAGRSQDNRAIRIAAKFEGIVAPVLRTCLFRKKERLVAMAGGKVYSFEEVAKHNEREDCWLIIAGKVYDVSPFMEEHPGGDEVLLACTGKDATADFIDIGHTATAKELMPQYCIGEVDASTIPSKIAYRGVAPQDASPKPDAASGSAWLTVLQLAVPLLLLVLAFALQDFAKSKTE
ncbi:hypothetical protein GUJ93_ZPchr0006g45164 [Zizania palustris]|uniref:Cytochrome b5 heme-binding domain-containing protein n=1 Tax=Zizania palustris TaxID=103762 RepID=A0A8J5SB91_ZIZPA|nr:hypothetical protein GUJ93_ZPchr0006g41411 [Zizania palustris]KAG8071645.1 hypothetical protein GUJ93_ZPchr0006g45164 [Zizania palustris]